MFLNTHTHSTRPHYLPKNARKVGALFAVFVLSFTIEISILKTEIKMNEQFCLFVSVFISIFFFENIISSRFIELFIAFIREYTTRP